MAWIAMIQSILVPSEPEKRLLARIWTKERRETDDPDVVSDKWTKLLTDKKPIWFEKKYEEDVANRDVLAWGVDIFPTESGETVGKNKGGRKKKNVAEENNVTPKNLGEELRNLEGRFKAGLDDTFSEMHYLFNSLDAKLAGFEKKIDDLVTRVKAMENTTRVGDKDDAAEGDTILEAIVADGTAKEKALEDDRSEDDAENKRRKEQEGPSQKEEPRKKQKVDASRNVDRSPIMTRQQQILLEQKQQHQKDLDCL